jgi:hypothetical protein
MTEKIKNKNCKQVSAKCDPLVCVECLKNALGCVSKCIVELDDRLIEVEKRLKQLEMKK